MKHNGDWYTKGEPRYIPMSDEELKVLEAEWLARDKKDKYGNFFFTHIYWERKCKKCGKEGMHYLNPDERPDDNEKVNVKKSKGKVKEPKEKKHGRDLTAYKDEKISKGAQPW